MEQVRQHHARLQGQQGRRAGPRSRSSPTTARGPTSAPTACGIAKTKPTMNFGWLKRRHGRHRVRARRRPRVRPRARGDPRAPEPEGRHRVEPARRLQVFRRAAELLEQGRRRRQRRQQVLRRSAQRVEVRSRTRSCSTSSTAHLIKGGKPTKFNTKMSHGRQALHQEAVSVGAAESPAPAGSVGLRLEPEHLPHRRVAVLVAGAVRVKAVGREMVATSLPEIRDVVGRRKVDEDHVVARRRCREHL